MVEQLSNCSSNLILKDYASFKDRNIQLDVEIPDKYIRLYFNDHDSTLHKTKQIREKIINDHLYQKTKEKIIEENKTLNQNPEKRKQSKLKSSENVEFSSLASMKLALKIDSLQLPPKKNSSIMEIKIQCSESSQKNLSLNNFIDSINSKKNDVVESDIKCNEQNSLKNIKSLNKVDLENESNSSNFNLHSPNENELPASTKYKIAENKIPIYESNFANQTRINNASPIKIISDVIKRDEENQSKSLQIVDRYPEEVKMASELIPNKKKIEKKNELDHQLEQFKEKKSRDFNSKMINPIVFNNERNKQKEKSKKICGRDDANSSISINRNIPASNSNKKLLNRKQTPSIQSDVPIKKNENNQFRYQNHNMMHQHPPIINSHRKNPPFGSYDDDENLGTYEELLKLDEKNYDVGMGYSEAELTKIQISKYKDSIEDKICNICYTVFEIDDDMPLLECLHKFHYNCLINWLQRKRKCPMNCEINL